jgi:hypothetical protein
VGAGRVAGEERPGGEEDGGGGVTWERRAGSGGSGGGVGGGEEVPPRSAGAAVAGVGGPLITKPRHCRDRGFWLHERPLRLPGLLGPELPTKLNCHWACEVMRFCKEGATTPDNRAGRMPNWNAWIGSLTANGHHVCRRGPAGRSIPTSWLSG